MSIKNRSDDTMIRNALFVSLVSVLLFACNPYPENTSWTYRTDSPVASQPACSVATGMLYVADIDGFIHAIDAATGEVKWKASCGSSVSLPLVLSGGSLCALTGEARLVVFNSVTGELTGKSEPLFQSPASAQLIVSGNTFTAVTFWDKVMTSGTLDNPGTVSTRSIADDLEFYDIPSNLVVSVRGGGDRVFVLGDGLAVYDAQGQLQAGNVQLPDIGTRRFVAREGNTCMKGNELLVFSPSAVDTVHADGTTSRKSFTADFTLNMNLEAVRCFLVSESRALVVYRSVVSGMSVYAYDLDTQTIEMYGTGWSKEVDSFTRLNESGMLVVTSDYEYDQAVPYKISVRTLTSAGFGTEQDFGRRKYRILEPLLTDDLVIIPDITGLIMAISSENAGNDPTAPWGTPWGTQENHP